MIYTVHFHQSYVECCFIKTSLVMINSFIIASYIVQNDLFVIINLHVFAYRYFENNTCWS